MTRQPSRGDQPDELANSPRRVTGPEDKRLLHRSLCLNSRINNPQKTTGKNNHLDRFARVFHNDFPVTSWIAVEAVRAGNRTGAASGAQQRCGGCVEFRQSILK